MCNHAPTKVVESLALAVLVVVVNAIDLQKAFKDFEPHERNCWFCCGLGFDVHCSKHAKRSKDCSIQVITERNPGDSPGSPRSAVCVNPCLGIQQSYACQRHFLCWQGITPKTKASR